MATMKFDTRLKLKYGTYAEWTASGAVTLLKGEIGICEIPASTTVTKDDKGGIKANAPVIMFKVGDGETSFANLPWASATAADVYSWAKVDYNTFLTQLKSDAGISGDVATQIATALNSYYTKSQIDGKVTELNTAITTAVNGEKSAREAADTQIRTDFAAADAAILGTSNDESSANTVFGAKKGVEEAKAAAQAADTKAAQGVADAATAKGLAEAAQRAADAAQDAADKAQGEVDALETVVAGKADASALNSYYTKTAADGKFATLTTVNGHTADIKAINDELDGLDAKFVDNDELAAAKTELNTAIGKKVDQTAYNTKVGALEDEDERLAGLIGGNTTKISALETASATHATKTELSTAVSDLKGTANDTASDETIAGAKKYADAKVAALVDGAPDALNTLDELAAALKDNADIVDVLEQSIGTKANQSDLTALSGRVSTLEGTDHTHSFVESELNKIVAGDVKKWNDEVTSGTNHRKDTTVHITADERTLWNTVSSKAAQSDLTALTGRVSTAEGKITTLEGKMTAVEGAVATKAEAEALNELAETVEGIDTAYKAADNAINTELAKKALQSDLSALQTKVNGIDNHSHSNKTVLDGITSTKVSNWDDANSKKHTHSNKTVLDGIDADDITTWNTVTSKAAQTDLNALDARVEALETMTLILDCGGPSTVTHVEA